MICRAFGDAEAATCHPGLQGGAVHEACDCRLQRGGHSKLTAIRVTLRLQNSLHPVVASRKVGLQTQMSWPHFLGISRCNVENLQDSTKRQKGSCSGVAEEGKVRFFAGGLSWGSRAPYL